MARKFSKSYFQLTSALQSTARLLGIKFLDHLVIVSAEYNNAAGCVSAMKGE